MPEVEFEAPKLPSTLTLTEETLPDIADLRVGEKYRVVLEVKQVGMDTPEDEKDKSPGRARFVVLSAKLMGKGMGKEEGEETGMEPEEEMGQEGTREKVIERIGEKAKEV